MATARAAAGDPGYRLVGRFDDRASVWQVVAPPAPAFVTLPGGFSAPQYVDGTVRYPLSSTAGVGVLEFDGETGDHDRAAIRCVSARRRDANVADLGLREGSDVHAAVRPRDLGARRRPARCARQLLVKVDPAATSDADAVSLTAPRAEPASGTPALHADRVSADPGF